MRNILTMTAAATILATGAFAASHDSTEGDAGAMSGEPMEPAAIANLMDADGNEAGVVQLWDTPHGVILHLEATGLAEGVHGFHIHETGECSGDFTSAGDHYAPNGNGHGMMTEDGPHAGDMPNVFADSNGMARADVFNTRVMLNDGDAALMDDDGSAIIIHEMGDSYQADAGAGGRVACGVIEAQSM